MLGFTLKYPSEMRVQVSTQPYAKDPSKTYHEVSFDILSDNGREGNIYLRAVESRESLDQQYADRELVRIREKKWHYFNSGKLLGTRYVNLAGEADPIDGQPKEYNWFWEEYITRLDPKWKFEVYAEYEDTKYGKVMDTMVRSIVFK